MGAVIINAVVQMVVDQGAFGVGHRLLDGVQLLSDIDAGLAVLNHGDDRTQMPFGAFQPGDHSGVACVAVWFCHIQSIIPPGGIGQGRRGRSVRVGINSIRQVVAGLLCLSLLLWSVQPSGNHAPTVIKTVQEHLEMIAEHGHSHGFEEDLIWAMHGHSHDEADHDHNQLALPAARKLAAMTFHRDPWVMSHAVEPSVSASLIERPPRV